MKDGGVDTTVIDRWQHKMGRMADFSTHSEYDALYMGSNYRCHSVQCIEVRFASLISGGCITAIVVNLLEKKLAKRTSVQCV